MNCKNKVGLKLYSVDCCNFDGIYRCLIKLFNLLCFSSK